MKEIRIYEVTPNGTLSWVASTYDADPEEELECLRKMLPEKNLTYAVHDLGYDWWSAPLIIGCACAVLGWIVYGINAVIEWVTSA